MTNNTKESINVEGLLEWVSPTEGRLRIIQNGYLRKDDDAFVPREFEKDFTLRPNNYITGKATFKKLKRKNGKKRPDRLTLDSIDTIDQLPPLDHKKRSKFNELTPVEPSPLLKLEHKNGFAAGRLIDMFCPIGFGTRGLIISPPKAGKTVLLEQIASSILVNHSNVKLIALLIDERPEEVTDFKRKVNAEVLASTNDDDVEAHVDLAIFTLERARRLVESGQDTVVLIDSLTRLGRAFNNSKKYGSRGQTMSGGLDSKALEIPKKLFGTARNIENGGSLTMIATCLVDTGSKSDQVIYEEFKGTGNMEMILDRNVAEQRLYPAMNIANSGTRNEHLLIEKKSLETITALRRRLINLKPNQQLDLLLKALKRFPTNADLLKG